jgi:hypothetical protein
MPLGLRGCRSLSCIVSRCCAVLSDQVQTKQARRAGPGLVRRVAPHRPAAGLPAGDLEMPPDGPVLVQRPGARAVASLPRHQHSARPPLVPVLTPFRVTPPVGPPHTLIRTRVRTQHLTPWQMKQAAAPSDLRCSAGVSFAITCAAVGTITEAHPSTPHATVRWPKAQRVPLCSRRSPYAECPVALSPRSLLICGEFHTGGRRVCPGERWWE